MIESGGRTMKEEVLSIFLMLDLLVYTLAHPALPDADGARRPATGQPYV